MCWQQPPIYQKQCHHHGSSNHRDMHCISCHRLQISSFDACWGDHPMEGEAVQKQHLMGNKCPCPLHIGHDEVRAGIVCGHPTIHALSSPAQTLGYVVAVVVGVAVVAVVAAAVVVAGAPARALEESNVVGDDDFFAVVAVAMDACCCWCCCCRCRCHPSASSSP